MELTRDWRISNAHDAIGELAKHEELTFNELKEKAPALGFDMGEEWHCAHIYGIVRGKGNEWWEKFDEFFT